MIVQWLQLIGVVVSAYGMEFIGEGAERLEAFLEQR